jgi:prophage antirepressor-like protein
MNQLALAVPANNPLDIFNFEGNEVRTTAVNGDPWFVANDISSALDYRDSFNMVRTMDDDEKGTHTVSTLGGDQQMLVINESGLYSAILRSRKPEAKRFKKWVTSVLIPGIRKKEFVHISEARSSFDSYETLRAEMREMKEMMMSLISAPIEVPVTRKVAVESKPAPVVLTIDQARKEKGLLSIAQIANRLGMKASRLNAIFEILGFHTRVSNRYTATSKATGFIEFLGKSNYRGQGSVDKYFWKESVISKIPKKYL